MFLVPFVATFVGLPAAKLKIKIAAFESIAPFGSTW